MSPIQSIAPLVAAGCAFLCPHVDGALIAHWAMDETSGQVAADSAGSSNGQLGTTAGADTSDPAINQPGVFGTAYDFTSAEGDRVDVSSSISNFSSLSSGSFTGWFNMSDTARGAFFNFGEASSTDRMILETTGNGNVRFVIRENNSNTTDLITSSTAFEDEEWHHFALINNGVSTRLFMDNVEVPLSVSINSGDWFSGITNPSTFTLGYEVRSNGTFPLNGSLDDFAVFDHALTETELGNVFNFGAENFAIPEPSTVALISLAGLGLICRRRR